MANTPEELRYHAEHAWAPREDGRVRVGITDYAQDELDTAVFVDLPEPETRVGPCPLGAAAFKQRGPRHRPHPCSKDRRRTTRPGRQPLPRATPILLHHGSRHP
jgi:hypothetical protein